MREAEFKAWMEAEGYAPATVNTQLNDVRRLDKVYGNLDELSDGQTLSTIRASLTYTMDDKRAGRSNPSKLEINGQIYENLAHFRAALNFYQRFLDAEASSNRGATFGLTPQNILDAIERCDAAESVEAFVFSHPGLGMPNKFWLLHRGRRYPPAGIPVPCHHRSDPDRSPAG